MPPASSAPPRPGPRSGLFLSVLVLPLLAASCLCPPESEDLLAVGFRTPEQTFRSFQTAVRADEPELEYRCFSAGFRERNDLSQLGWREFREWLRGEHPWLRSGIAKAEIVAVERKGSRCRIDARSLGHDLTVLLVREEFSELWAEGVLVDEREIRAADWDAWVQARADENGRTWISAGTPLPEGRAAQEITELRWGREWKIEDFWQPEDDPGRAP